MGQALLAQFSWRALGPDNLGSTTRSIVFDANGNLIAGSESGGLWRSDNLGVSWTRLESYSGNPNVTSIAVSGNTLYVATGATQFGGESFYAQQGIPNYDISDSPQGVLGYTRLPGAGVYVSTDNGSTWSNNNATTKAPFNTLNYEGPFVGIQKVFVKGSRVFVATREGLYYSDDQLATVQKSTGSAAFGSSVFYDIEAGAGDVIFAAGTNTASLIDDSLYVSANNGQSFTAVNAATFFANGKFSFQRIAIAVAPSDPNIVYVAGTRSVGELSGVWRSDDNGATWRRYAPSGSSGFTPLSTAGQDAFTLEVFPDNPNEVIVAGNAWYTFVDGRGWTQTAQHFNPTRADYIPTRIQCAVFAPGDPNIIMIGTDRQIARSMDRGKTFSQKSKGYESTPTYTVGALSAAGREAVLSGSQRNGLIFNGNISVDEVYSQGFGDINAVNGGQVEVSYLHPTSVIYQGTDGGLVRSNSSGNAFELFYGFPVSPQVAGLEAGANDSADIFVDRMAFDTEGGRLEDRGGAPVTPYVLDEVIPAAIVDDPNANAELIQAVPGYVFFCSRQFVWIVQGPFRTGLQGEATASWNRISNSLVSGTEFFTAIAVSGSSDHTVYVGSSAGNVWRITNPTDLENFNAATNVAKLSISSTNLPTGGRWVSSIAVDPQDPQRVAITYGAYGGNLAAAPPMVYFSASAITAPFFTPISTTIVKEPVYCSQWVIDPATGSSILMIGTESNLYSARNISPGFADFRPEFGPAVGPVPVYDIFVRKYVATTLNAETQDFRLDRDNTIFVATHGRGIWTSASLRYPRKGLPGEEETAAQSLYRLALYPNPTQGAAVLSLDLAEQAQVRITMFGTDGRAYQVQHDDSYKRGEHEVSLPTDQLLPGIYMVNVEVTGENGTLTQSFKSVVIR
jgi:hypothetical protein